MRRYSASAIDDSAWHDTVHVADRQAGVIEGRLDHGDLERAAVQVELAGGRREIGDADDRGLSSQRISHLSPLGRSHGIRFGWRCRPRGRPWVMAGVAIITEACIDTKDRACVDVCPVQCIYEFDPAEEPAVLRGAGRQRRDREHAHPAAPSRSRSSLDTILYVNTEECTSCTACYQPDVCPVGAIYSEEVVPDGQTKTHYNSSDPNKGHDHTFFIQLSRDVFAD